MAKSAFECDRQSEKVGAHAINVGNQPTEQSWAELSWAKISEPIQKVTTFNWKIKYAKTRMNKISSMNMLTVVDRRRLKQRRRRRRKKRT